MIVIGVDPGTIKAGYGVIRKDGNRVRRIDSGVIRLNQKEKVEDRLPVLYEKLCEIITLHNPDSSAVEDMFFAKNANSALKLGHARGVIVLALKQHGLPLSSYSPTFVKNAIVGAGRAPKSQIQKTMAAILGIREPLAEDEADALAVALCHANAR